MKISKIIRIVVILAVVVTLGYFAIQQYYLNEEENDDPNSIKTSGVVESIEVRIGTKVSGPITKLLVEEGDFVQAGQLVAEIDSIDHRLQLEEALAAVNLAKALHADTLKGLRPTEIVQLEKIVAAKQAMYEKAKIDYETKKSLADTKIGPIKEADLARKQMEAADKDLETAREQVKIAQLGGRDDQIRAASYTVSKAEAVVAEIQQKISDSEIRAPRSGYVSVKNMETGEIAAAGSTLVTIIDLEKPWVRVFIPETKLGRIRLGMEAEILSDSFEDRVFSGIIRYISPKAEFTPKNVQTKEERVKLVYALKIYIDNPDQKFKPGMPVDAIIRFD